MAAAQDRTPRLQHLAALVTQRRASLGWTKEKAAAECGVAYMTYDRIENGETVQARTYLKVENAFGFAPGACRTVLAGADAMPMSDGTEMVVAVMFTSVPVPSDGLAEEIQRAVTVATIATTPGLPAGQVGALNERILEELRKRGVLPQAG